MPEHVTSEKKIIATLAIASLAYCYIPVQVSCLPSCHGKPIENYLIVQRVKSAVSRATGMASKYCGHE